MKDLGKEYERRHLFQTAAYIRKVKAAYEGAIEEVVIGIDRITFKGKVFKVADFPQLKRKIDNAIKRLQPKVQTLVVNGIKDSWDLSNEKNNLFVDRRIAGKTLKTRARKIYYDPNEKALNQFMEREVKGLKLSKRVWNLTKPFATELEAGLALGISEGQSAATMARDLKRYLNEPDKLFRRVKNAEGKLVLSKAAQDYHPGQGVYRSSYKNAVRLTRTENNIAYRTADHERWKTLPFVTGIQVQLSNAHPKYDICDPLAGKYPKDFKFVSWHPQCLCYAVPMMMSDSEYDKLEDAILSGDPIPDPKSQVENIPAKASNWLEKNAETINGWKNKPYFVKDNPGYIKL